MGKPIPYDLRVKIVRDHESGRTQNAIAEEIGCSKDAVKKLLRQYRQKGESALKADYSKCGKSSRHHFSAEIEAEVMRRKDLLPGPAMCSVYFVKPIVSNAYPLRVRFNAGGLRLVIRVLGGAHDRRRTLGRRKYIIPGR